MRSAIFATLVLLAGCGNYHSRTVVTTYPQPTPQPDPYNPGVDAFVADVNAGVVADPDTFAITTDGNTWRLAWLGDAYERNFRGTISCPAGCQFTYARFANAYPGDTVTINGGVVTFDAVTNAAVPQYLDLSAPLQPLTYDLQIDGQDAIGAVVFQSYGVRSTTDVMPFSLYSSNAVRSSDKTTAAPQFISLMPKNSTETAMILPPGQGSSGGSSEAVKQ